MLKSPKLENCKSSPYYQKLQKSNFVHPFVFYYYFKKYGLAKPSKSNTTRYLFKNIDTLKLSKEKVFIPSDTVKVSILSEISRYRMHPFVQKNVHKNVDYQTVSLRVKKILANK